MCSKNLLFLELAFYRSIQPRCSVNTSIPTNHSKFEPIATSLPFYCSRAVWQEQLCFKIQVSLDHLRAQLVTWTNKGGESKEWWLQKVWKQKGNQVITCHCQGVIATTRGYCNDGGMACHWHGMLYPEVDREDLTGSGSFQRSDHCL